MGKSEELEARVQHWFELAKEWDAMLLLDEADIFLTYRQKNDRERNLLVSGQPPINRYELSIKLITIHSLSASHRGVPRGAFPGRSVLFLLLPSFLVEASRHSSDSKDL